jgi:hypothetical protein
LRDPVNAFCKFGKRLPSGTPTHQSCGERLIALRHWMSGGIEFENSAAVEKQGQRQEYIGVGSSDAELSLHLFKRDSFGLRIKKENDKKLKPHHHSKEHKGIPAGRRG